MADTWSEESVPATRVATTLAATPAVPPVAVAPLAVTVAVATDKRKTYDHTPAHARSLAPPRRTPYEMHWPNTMPSLHYLLPMQTLQGGGRHLRSLPAPRQRGHGWSPCTCPTTQNPATSHRQWVAFALGYYIHYYNPLRNEHHAHAHCRSGTTSHHSTGLWSTTPGWRKRLQP